MNKEFKEQTTYRMTEYGIFFETEMPNCKYGQAFSKKDLDSSSIADLKERYFKWYLPVYQEDLQIIEGESLYTECMITCK